MNKPVRTHLVTTPQASASSVFGLYDTLVAAGRDWEMLVSGEEQTPVFDVSLVGPSDQPFPCGNGLRIVPDMAFKDAHGADIVVVPGLNLSPKDRLDRAEHPALQWLESQAQNGARVVSACTGAVYLAETGMLDRMEATTHWAFSDLFRWFYPQVRLRLDRGICFEDANRGVVTSGGTTGWQELALFLITNYGGAQRAARTAKVWLMADRGELQTPYNSLIRNSPHADAAVAATQTWLSDNYTAANPVAEMTTVSGLPPTTFSRRFRAATGLSPLEYVHALRVEEAKQLLETTDASVASIGEDVGYTDTASFRKLFKRRTGLTPADHRRMFGKARFSRYR